jgi:hypothetical protein
MAPEAVLATMGTAVGAVILGLGMYVMNMLQKCLHTCQNDGQGHSPLLRFIFGEITLTEGMWPDLFWCCPMRLKRDRFLFVVPVRQLA